MATYDLQTRSGQEIAFGPFRLHPEQRLLLRADTPLPLGNRARDILLALVERAGEIVKRSELMARVWPDTLVEEGSLRVHIAGIACLSQFHFARAFKAAIGQSPHQYVSAQRLERAKELLIRADQSLADIALALNFSCQATFTRASHQVTGQTPGQYRRRFRSK